MTLLELKPVTLTQLPALLDLDYACFGGLWTMEGYQRELDSPNSIFVGLSEAFGAKSLLGMGCAWAILDEAHITILAVHPDYQGQGLGQALLYSLLHTAALSGLERATLEVRASNTPALSLYQKFGFKTAGRRRRYYQDTGEDALILWRSGLCSSQVFTPTLADSEHQIRDRLAISGWNLHLATTPLPFT